jgi:hypothetical protein
MNLVHHDVNMKMLLVVVSDDNVLVVLVAKLVQRVQGRINPLCATDVLLEAMPVHSGKLHRCNVGSEIRLLSSRLPLCRYRQGCSTLRHLLEEESSPVSGSALCEVFSSRLKLLLDFCLLGWTLAIMYTPRVDLFGDHSDSSSFLTTVSQCRGDPCKN